MEYPGIRYKAGVEDCRKEYWHDRCIKTPCGECQACMGQKKSGDIEKAHVVGKFCEEANLCPKCSRIKYLIRAIKHLSGNAVCSRKCELCNNLPRYRAPNLIKLVSELYNFMFYGQRYKPWPS